MYKNQNSFMFNINTILVPSILIAISLLPSADLYGQFFTKVTDGSNPIVSNVGPTGYSGVSWIDIDSDGDLDLFINNSFLYLNEGSGTFSRLSSTLGSGQGVALGNGQTWGDYDNNGNVDVYIASLSSKLYRSNGDNTFSSITSGDIGDSFGNRGWSPTWAISSRRGR